LTNFLKLAKEKHSSLFFSTGSYKEKKFYGIDTWMTVWLLQVLPKKDLQPSQVKAPK
jgi:hypothetical protein